MIQLKNQEQINCMTKAGSKLATWMSASISQIREGQINTGVNLKETFIAWKNKLGDEWTTPFSEVANYQEPICVSINDELVHSRPTANPFQSGDIITIDAGLAYRGWCADMARTVLINSIPTDDLSEMAESDNLIITTQYALKKGTEQCIVGNKIQDISAAIWLVAQQTGYGIIIDYSGHGIGKDLHEEPLIPNTIQNHSHAETILRAGMVVCLEPMLTLGQGKTIVDQDGWRVFTADGSKAAHMEDTIVITKQGPKILTKEACLKF